MKLYEILWNKMFGDKTPAAPKPQMKTKQNYNPIGCDLNSIVKIDAIDFRDYRFSVKEVKNHSIIMGGKTHNMVDFILESNKFNEGKTFCLRVVPNKNSKSSKTYRILVMNLYDSLAYDEGLHGVVKDDTKKFVIDDDTDESNIIHDEFWRVNDVGISYSSNVKSLPEDKCEIEFWDYSRNTDVDGVEVEEFVFVQMDKKTGWFEIWRGSEVDPNKVEVF